MMNIKKISLVVFSVVLGLTSASAAGAHAGHSHPETNLSKNETGIGREARQEIKREIKATITQQVGEKLRKLESKVTVNGVITAVGTNSITVTSDGKSYVVNVTTSTQDSQGTVLRRRFLGKATFAEFSVNNKVKVVGTWVDEAKTTINATRIWNMSISKYRGAFVGEVVSLDATTIVFSPVKREKHTAYLSSTTKYLNRTGEAISLSDIVAGHKIKVRGTWDKSNKKVFDVISVVDMSLPPLPTKTR